MRKVTFGCACSLDQYIARADGAVDWLRWSDEAAAVTREYWPKIDTILLGRKTYEVALAHQAQAGKAAVNPYGDLSTYVFSRTLKEAPGVELVAGGAADFLRELKSRPGREICLMGGGELARTFFEAGLVDEVGLNVHPVLLGRGVPLFREMSRQIELDLVECRPFANGCVYQLYRVK